jgi:hypothetical protein
MHKSGQATFVISRFAAVSPTGIGLPAVPCGDEGACPDAEKAEGGCEARPETDYSAELNEGAGEKLRF